MIITVQRDLRAGFYADVFPLNFPLLLELSVEFIILRSPKLTE